MSHRSFQQSSESRTHLELAAPLVNVDEAKVDCLSVVRLRRLLEKLLEGQLGSIRVLEVEERDPDVELLLLLAEVDRLERTTPDLAGLLDLREGEEEGDVLDPEVGRVGRPEEEALKVGDGRRRLALAGSVLERVVRLALLRRRFGDSLLLVERLSIVGDLLLALALGSVPVEASGLGKRCRRRRKLARGGDGDLQLEL